jgi:hypothetical protein
MEHLLIIVNRTKDPIRAGLIKCPLREPAASLIAEDRIRSHA